MTSAAKTSRQCAIWGSFIGDAIAMPVHWYYKPSDIKDGYGNWLTGYVAPNRRHPIHFLSLGQADQPIIGSVILHDKLTYWQSEEKNGHLHQGMAAGDNTLNSRLAAQSAKVLAAADSSRSEDDLLADVMTEYVKFMTTPGTHNDTYAESAHREFFRDWHGAGSPPSSKDVMAFVQKRIKTLKPNPDHDGIGALVLSIPVVLHYSDKPEDDAAKNAVRTVHASHSSNSLDPYVELFARSLHSVVNGAKLKEVADKALSSKLLGGPATLERAQQFSKDAAAHAIGSESRLSAYQDALKSFGLACHPKGSLPGTFFLASEFHDDFEAGVLTNANCGGDNAHRGAVLGSLLGAEAGRTGRHLPQSLIDGLHSSKEDILTVLQN